MLISEIYNALIEGKKLVPCCTLMFKPFPVVSLKATFDSGDTEYLSGVYPSIDSKSAYNKIVKAEVVSHTSLGYKKIEYIHMNEQRNRILAKLEGLAEEADYPFGFFDLKKEWIEYKKPMHSKIIIENCSSCGALSHSYHRSEFLITPDKTLGVFCPITKEFIVI